jgi:hypothetical protein
MPQGFQYGIEFFPGHGVNPIPLMVKLLQILMP